ncbi:patatin-domain-containing protein [Phaffia rhodozyma]|uniref:Lysophospholipase NTE1 n=1 Tax=Phaffia rhodozyma TaxID=264483 RepID=A0A0F7SQ41_PHARH|nr:patatin-domain-containing protein [Phaffia rhodozyma]
MDRTLAIPTLGNPLVSLLMAIVRAAIYCLQLTRQLITFLTLTLPRIMIIVVNWSWTFQLNFPIVLFILCLIPVGFFLLVRYKYLTKYTELKEDPLSKSDTNSLHPDVLSETATKPLNNYLDEFLSAIRVFGFLEKPVFHELSRHLQTRRLVAGDSLTLDSSDKSFYCVVDGHVQVFAPSPPSLYPPHPVQSHLPSSQADLYTEEDEPPLNGYDLLTEVSSGGTLSSLFTILSLFTEDVKLSWDDSPPQERESQFGAGYPSENGETLDSLGLNRQGVRSPASSAGTALPEDVPLGFYEGITPSGEYPDRAGSTNSFMGAESGSSFKGYNYNSVRGDTPNLGLQANDEERVARATVDTTLAVIPADAFRRLTRKFPKASAHIVQVILTRFSRVTFTTAHQYLGLTSEVLRAESTLNSLVSHPLPAEFYEGGGMQALREKFRQETKSTKYDSKEDSDDDSRRTPGRGGSYFPTINPKKTSSVSSASSGKTARTKGASPMVGSPDMSKSRPAPGSVLGRSTTSPTSTFAKLKTPLEPSPENEVTPVAPSTAVRTPGAFSSSSSSPSFSAKSSAKVLPPVDSPNYSRQSHPLFRRSSTMRQVQAGDLLSMTSDEDNAMYRNNHQSPTTPRPIKWDRPMSTFASLSSGILAGSNWDNHLNTHAPYYPEGGFSSDRVHSPPLAASLKPQFNLRDAVMTSLAKSIGLIQPPAIEQTPSIFSPSDSNSSKMNSPSFGGSISSALRGLTMLGGRGVDDSSSIMTGTSGGWGADEGGVLELENEVEILFYPKGEYLVKEGEKNAGLFFIIEGFLDVSLPPPDVPTKPVKKDTNSKKGNGSSGTSSSSKPSSKTATSSKSRRYSTVDSARSARLASMSSGEDRRAASETPKASNIVPGSTHLYTVKPGGIAGYLSALSNAASYVDLRAKTDVYVGFLPAEALERLLERRPIVLLTLAKRLLSLLSPLVQHVDASLDWMQLDAGQVLYRQGDVADSIYIVVNGRLRALVENKQGDIDIAAEYGQGESVGEMDAIMINPRGSTIHAIRDTELVRMPLTLFNAISVRHPATTVKFLRLIASRVTKVVDQRSRPSLTPGSLEVSPSNLNLKTIAILPSSKHVPIAIFAKKLKAALEDIGAPTAYLDQATVMRHLGRHTFSSMGALKVAGWLSDLEQRHRTVLYVADAAVGSQWTLTCLRQADHIMVVGMGDDPSIGEYEKVLLAKKTSARKELVLLHPERSVPHGSTRPWLKERPWISQHHHVELPGIVLPAKSTPMVHDPAAIVAFKNLREKVQTQIKRFRPRPMYRPRASPHLNDFARLARNICGASIGIVLGGGGGRGIAHLGFIEAMEDQGVPIDMIGGTSIGSFIGGLYAKDGNLVATTGRAKQFSGRISSIWRLLSDVTFPTISYTTGHEFNRGIFKAFGDAHLEDLWIPFFCNSTCLNLSQMEIHTTGYAWRAVRASMTLAGLLPPLSDNGNMLVDGGYIDNLPVTTMTAKGASKIFAIDVGGVDDPSPRNYGDSVSGFFVLLNRYNPFSDARLIPTLTEVTSRLTYVSSVKSLEEAKNTPGILYLAMPVQQYETLGGFGKFNEILDIGRKAAREYLATCKSEGTLPTGYLPEHDRAAESGSGRIKKSIKMRRNSI